MSTSRLVARLRRHWAAVAAVLVLALGMAYQLKTAPPTYSDSSAIVFTAAEAAEDTQAANPASLVGPSLISSEVIMADTITSPGMVHEIRAAGGTASFTMTPFNLYNLQYPYYAAPTATLTATSPSAALAQRTFTVAVRLLAARLAAIQADAAVPPADRIHIYTAGTTGAVMQPGSTVRAFGGLFLLTLMALVTVTNVLDRRARRGTK
jgi:hypothetical protein